MASGRAWFLSVAIGGAVLVAGGVGAILSKRAAPGDAAAKGPPPPAPVQTARVRTGDLIQERRYMGEVWATSDAALTVAEAGRVQKVTVAEGAKVKKGDLLLELDDSLARAELRRARASLLESKAEAKYAEREAERFEKLERERVASDLETSRQKAAAATSSARAAAASAAARVGSERVRRHRIIAPFDGVVAARNVDPGDWLDPGQTAVQLVTERRIEVLVRVPSIVLDSLKQLKGTRLVKDGREASAEITGTVNALERSTRTGLLRLEPKRAPDWLRPGDSLEVAFDFARGDGLIVPRDALVYGVAGVRVVVVRDGKAKPVSVEVLVKSTNDALVKAEGLRESDVVVVRGNERLRPDQPVAPQAASAAPPNAAPASSAP